MERNESPDFSNLPKDILQEVADRLDPVATERFRVTNTGVRADVESYRNQTHPPLPFNPYALCTPGEPFETKAEKAGYLEQNTIFKPRGYIRPQPLQWMMCNF